MMTPRALSAHMLAGNGAPVEDWRAIRSALTAGQVQAIHDKCQWEQASWLAVLRDWPSMFEPIRERTTDA